MFSFWVDPVRARTVWQLAGVKERGGGANRARQISEGRHHAERRTHLWPT